MSLIQGLRFKHIAAVSVLVLLLAWGAWRFTDLTAMWQRYASGSNTATDKAAVKTGDKSKYSGGRPGNKDMGEGGGKPTPVSLSLIHISEPTRPY